MASRDDFVAPCPACEGAGCTYCENEGVLVVPSKIEAFVTRARHSISSSRRTRSVMLATYERWISATPAQRAALKRIMETNGETFETLMDVDLTMSSEIVASEDNLEMMGQMLEQSEQMHQDARKFWQEAKNARKASLRPAVKPVPEPQETKRTKAAGKVCKEPKCKKDAKVWDERGRGWCRRHAYQRGLLDRPKVDEDDGS